MMMILESPAPPAVFCAHDGFYGDRCWTNEVQKGVIAFSSETGDCGAPAPVEQVTSA